jgi:DNA-directed RNA polymerase subunit L
LGNKILGKRVNDVDIKIAAYKILHPYQGDSYFALCSSGAQPVSRSAPEIMPIAC